MRQRLLVLLGAVTVFCSVWAWSEKPTNGIGEQLIGSWSLVSRQTTLESGKVLTDPGLSAMPKGILIYDRSGHVAAQLSRTTRTVATVARECPDIEKIRGTNDTAQTVLGYDAYFGTYTIDSTKGIVTHHLESALFPEDVGKDIKRQFSLSGDKLTIQFNTTLPDGTPIKRTLVWSLLK